MSEGPTHEEQIEAGLQAWTEKIREQHQRASMTTKYIGLESVRFKLFELIDGHKHSSEGAGTKRRMIYHDGVREGLDLALRILTTSAVILPGDVTETFKANMETAACQGCGERPYTRHVTLEDEPVPLCDECIAGIQYELEDEK